MHCLVVAAAQKRNQLLQLLLLVLLSVALNTQHLHTVLQDGEQVYKKKFNMLQL
jgi:hypothetical protein